MMPITSPKTVKFLCILHGCILFYFCVDTLQRKALNYIILLQLWVKSAAVIRPRSCVFIFFLSLLKVNFKRINIWWRRAIRIRRNLFFHTIQNEILIVIIQHFYIKEIICISLHTKKNTHELASYFNIL